MDRRKSVQEYQCPLIFLCAPSSFFSPHQSQRPLIRNLGAAGEKQVPAAATHATGQLSGPSLLSPYTSSARSGHLWCSPKPGPCSVTLEQGHTWRAFPPLRPQNSFLSHSDGVPGPTVQAAWTATNSLNSLSAVGICPVLLSTGFLFPLIMASGSGAGSPAPLVLQPPQKSCLPTFRCTDELKPPWPPGVMYRGT